MKQLMSDFEHMKTSLYLTDVVVLRHEGDTVNFLGLEITKTCEDFEVKKSTDLVESLLNLYGLENSKPTANPGRRPTAVELASATPLDGIDYSNFRTAVGKLIFMALWRQICNSPFHTIPQSHNREQARSETVDTISQRHAQHLTCLRLEPGGNSDWVGDSATRQSVTEYHCNVQGVTMCNRSLKQTAVSFISCEAELYAASACAGELLGLTELFKELHYNVSVCL